MLVLFHKYKVSQFRNRLSHPNRNSNLSCQAWKNPSSLMGRTLFEFCERRWFRSVSIQLKSVFSLRESGSKTSIKTRLAFAKAKANPRHALYDSAAEENNNPKILGTLATYMRPSEINYSGKRYLLEMSWNLYLLYRTHFKCLQSFNNVPILPSFNYSKRLLLFRLVYVSKVCVYTFDDR